MASLHPRRLFAELFVHNLRIRAWRAGWWWVTKSSSGFRRGPERHRGQWVVSGELTRFSQAPQYGPASPTDRLLKRMETGRGGCCNPSPASVSDQVHQTSYPYEEAFIQDTGAIHKKALWEFTMPFPPIFRDLFGRRLPGEVEETEHPARGHRGGDGARGPE